MKPSLGNIRWAVLTVAIPASILLSIPGCDQSFNPKAPFQQELVVFSVLSNDRDMEFVRLSTKYDVSGFDPSENRTDQVVGSAHVGITGPSGAFVFRDTLLPRSDTSRYTTPILAYVASPFRVERGKSYILSVTTKDLGTASAAVTVPEEPIISIGPGPLVLERPDQFESKSTFAVVARLSHLCKGYRSQVFVDYQVLVDSGWKNERVEVPMVVFMDTLDTFIASYPELSRALYNQVATTYYIDAYKKVLVKVLMHYYQNTVRFKRVVLRVLQCERAFYDYLSTVNGFRDRVSIRVDQPDYTNIAGGIGVFGAYTLDSLTYTLPDDFSLNWR